MMILKNPVILFKIMVWFYHPQITQIFMKMFFNLCNLWTI
jgi:hypothetical protein